MRRVIIFGVVCLLLFVLPLSFVRAETTPAMTMVPLSAGTLARDDGSTVKLAAFSIAATELTREQWDSVRQWAVKHGYDFGTGNGEAARYPISAVTWYDAVKFCNAASERAGRTPVYQIDGKVFRSGISDNVQAVWSANGYRLPSEAEWEYACRAGTTTKYYWGDQILPWKHNPHAWFTHAFARGDDVSPRPVAKKKPNAFGLYDTSGNVYEWCWDWYAAPYDSSVTTNPRGPKAGNWRVIRGGSVGLDSVIASGYRSCVEPAFNMYDLGFRVVSTDPTCPAIAVDAGVQHVPMTRDMTEPDARTVAQRLFALIDLSKPGLGPVAAALKAKQYKQALILYRDYFFAAKHTGHGAKPFGRGPKPAKLKKFMAAKGRVPWYKPLVPGGPVYIQRPDKPFLLGEWTTTHNDKYLRQWFYLASQFAVHAKADFLMLDNAGRASKNSYNMPLTWDWGMGYNNYRHLLGRIQRVINNLPRNGASQIPAKQLAEILTFVATDGADLQIKDPRDVVPNQSYSVAMSLLKLASQLPNFKDAPAWTALAMRRFRKDATRTILADGGDLEQSLNYNAALPAQIHKLVDMYSPHAPAWVSALKPIIRKRLRMFASMLTPFGVLPTTGSYYTFYPTDIYRDAQHLRAMTHSRLGSLRYKWKRYSPDPVRTSIVNTMLNPSREKPQVKPPDFTSVAFPYSGYYVMRDGWSPFSHYLWLMGARPGTGHSVHNINGIEVAAYGRWMLIAAGASSYGNPVFVAKDQRDIIGQIDKYRSQAASRNTVVVDGKGQNRRGHNTPYSKPIPARWHTSKYFDFAEGDFGARYDAHFGENIRADHHREIIFLRQHGLWLVTDRLTSDSPHTYSATWGFLPIFKTRLGMSAGFTDKQIKIDAEAHAFGTHDPDGPNVFLYQACATPITYKRFYGQLNPALGWMAPAIGSRREPKTDIWSSWHGDAGASQLITAICPAKDDTSPVTRTKDLSHGDITGLRLELRDGTTVIWLTSPDTTTLAAGPLTVNGKGLLLVTDGSGHMRGIALGCEKLTVNKAQQTLAFPDFEFAVAGRTLAQVRPIQKPTGFTWGKTPAGIEPVYQVDRTQHQAAVRGSAPAP